MSSLQEKHGCCPHCGGRQYYRFDKDHGTQLFKCKDCGRTFTEYTATWELKLHKKSIVNAYVRLMTECKFFDTISGSVSGAGLLQQLGVGRVCLFVLMAVFQHLVFLLPSRTARAVSHAASTITPLVTITRRASSWRLTSRSKMS